MKITREEQETTIAWCAADDVVRIYSAVPHHLRRMRKDPAFVETRTYGVDAAEFEIQRDLFDPMRGRRRPRALSDEQREAARERGRQNRAAQLGSGSPLPDGIRHSDLADDDKGPRPAASERVTVTQMNADAGGNLG